MKAYRTDKQRSEELIKKAEDLKKRSRRIRTKIRMLYGI